MSRSPHALTGAITSTIINPADICGLILTDNPTDPTGQFAFGLTIERAAQSPSDHRLLTVLRTQEAGSWRFGRRSQRDTGSGGRVDDV